VNDEKALMTGWSGITYRGFYDVPRMILASCDGQMHLFDSRFDDELDDYIDYYEVWRLPPLTDAQIKGSWLELAQLALERMPDIGLTELPFDWRAR
jgi:hypothetical protein